MSGKNELDIDTLTGFREPTKEEHEQLFTLINKNYKKVMISSIFWMIAFSLIAIFYTVMSIASSNSEYSSFYGLTIFIFIFLLVSCIYKFTAIDLKTYKSIKSDDYAVRNVKIHHLMPWTGTTYGRGSAKIKDENENVYFYDFKVNKKIKKKYKENPETLFLLTKINSKKALYNLLYLELENNNANENEKEKM